MMQICSMFIFPEYKALLYMQHRYKDIVEWYQKLASDYSDIVKYVDSIGRSIEGRDMPAVHFTKNTAPKYTVYFQCQIHASTFVGSSYAH